MKINFCLSWRRRRPQLKHYCCPRVRKGKKVRERQGEREGGSEREAGSRTSVCFATAPTFSIKFINIQLCLRCKKQRINKYLNPKLQTNKGSPVCTLWPSLWVGVGVVIFCLFCPTLATSRAIANCHLTVKWVYDLCVLCCPTQDPDHAPPLPSPTQRSISYTPTYYIYSIYWHCSLALIHA